MRQRTIVCPLIQNDGCYLLCKMADDRGVFPGQWALSGGGVEPGERIEEALRRSKRRAWANNWCYQILRHGPSVTMFAPKRTPMAVRKRFI